MRLKIYLVMGWILSCPAVALAQEAVEKTSGWLDILNSEGFIKIVVALVVMAWGIAKKTKELKKERYAKAIEFLEEGIKETWDETGKALKVAAADGKFTKAEKKMLMETAKNKAVSYAKEEGWDLLKSVSKKVIPVLIEKIVKSRKAPKE